MLIGRPMAVTGELTPLSNALEDVVGGILPDPPKKVAKSKQAGMTADEREALSALFRQHGVARLRELEERGFDRAEIRDLAAAVAVDTLSRLLGGEFPIKDGDQAIKVADLAVKIMRLESQQATSIVGHEDDPKARFIEIRQKIEQARGLPPGGTTT